MSKIKQKILVVDDESQIRRFMRVSLTAEGYDYLEATTAQEAVQQVAWHNPGLVILDLGLPDHDGSYVLKKLREWSSVPVLVLTARDEEDEKVSMLRAGANDYLTKPFGVAELMARVYVLLRDIQTGTDLNGQANLEFDDLTIDRECHQVLLEKRPVALSRKEYKLLNFLASHDNKLVTQEHLLNEIWGESHRDDTHYLRIFISQLRKKLGDNVTHPRFIETEPGVGYRFIGKNTSSDQ